MNEAKIEPTQEEIEYLTAREGDTRLDNDGNVVINNRAERRKKLPKLRIMKRGRVIVPENALTRATHSIKLARAKSKKAYRKNH